MAWHGAGRGLAEQMCACHEPEVGMSSAALPSLLEEGTLLGAQANGLGVLLVRREARVFALADRCSHRGCALHEGTLNDDGTVTCPCHGSTFRLDGTVVKGPATSPQPAFAARMHEGKVEIRRAG